MKLGILISGIFMISGITQLSGISDLLIRFDRPADFWTEALPIGNGSLGAMVFGGPSEEHIQFNEDTLWSGTVHQYQNEGSYKYLHQLRRLLREGKQEKAEALAMEHFMSIPLRQMMYQPFGDIWIQFNGHEPASGYQRYLDLKNAESVVSYFARGVHYKRETIASYPGKIIAQRISSDQPGSIDFSLGMTTEHSNAVVRVDPSGELILSGKVDNPGGLTFAARLKVIPENGSMVIGDGRIRVKGADSVLILLSAATSYIDFRDISGDPLAVTRTALAAQVEQGYARIREAHRADYHELFNRVTLDLGASDFENLPIDQRLAREHKEDDPQLVELLYQYGRYLLISSSRPGSQPANLQGIWNDQIRPPWGCKYTLNINAEMNYWPAEVANLPECAEPLFAMIEDLVISGGKTARAHYDARGWVVHHNTDIWRGTAPINHANHGIWPAGAGWLCQHLWEHWRYSGDRAFLAEVAYPVMRKACLFYMDYLVEDSRTGYLISGPSNSPEQGGLVMGPTMDHQIIRGLFEWTATAADILGVDEHLADQLNSMRSRIAPNQIGRLGQLQEWMQDLDDPDNRHRHVSHLWGVFPGDDITWDKPELMKAARQSLLFRGDGGTGWALGWKVSLWARFLDGNHAHKILMNQLNLVRQRADGRNVGGGGVYANLFDAHPPFQIDGNFAATAGVSEMLMQSHGDEIVLLPALPVYWPDGYIKGLRARGGFLLDIHWKNGKLEQVSVMNPSGGLARIRYGESTREIPLEKNETATLSNLFE